MGPWDPLTWATWQAHRTPPVGWGLSSSTDMLGAFSHSCRTTFTSTCGRRQSDLPFPRCPGRTRSSAGPRQSSSCPYPTPPGPPRVLTERDSTETVSTIRGPSECRFNSSWDFSAACGAGRAAEGSGTDILLLNRDLSSSPFLPMLSVNSGGRALPGLTCFPGFHL